MLFKILFERLHVDNGVSFPIKISVSLVLTYWNVQQVNFDILASHIKMSAFRLHFGRHFFMALCHYKMVKYLTNSQKDKISVEYKK